MRRIMLSRCAIACVVVALGMLPARAVVADGQTDLSQTTAVYVPVDAAKEELAAAKELAKYLGSALGTKVTVNPTAQPYSPAVPHAVFLGARLALESGILTQADLKALKWDGFAIGFSKGCVAIAGNKPTSVNNGVVELLQRVGYLFYSYGQQHLPEKPTTVFRDGVLRRNPAFEYRAGGWFWYHRGTPALRGNPRAALDPELFKDSRLESTHTAAYLVPKELYFEKHPEYYAMNLQGKREFYSKIDSYVHLCMSNPDAVKIATARVLAWVRMQPDKVFFCVTQGDGHDWCQCPKCKAHDVHEGNYSDRLLELLVNPIARAVGREFPKAKIVTLAYCGTDEPPAKVKPEKNVYVMYCPYWGIALSMAHPLTHPLNAESERQLRGWLKVAPNNMMIYDYNLYFCLSWDAWAEKLKWYHQHGIREGILMCGIPMCFRDLFAYINAELQWDPELDAEELKRRYVEVAYGAAAPDIMAYLGMVRERLDKGYFVGIHGATWTGFFTGGAMPRMVAAFDRALAAVEDDAKRTRAIQSEFDQLLDAYLYHAVSADILASGRTSEVRDDLDRKVGNLTWTLTEGDRECARLLVNRRLEQYLRKHTELEEKLAGKLPDATRKVLTGQQAKLVGEMRRLLTRMGPMSIPKETNMAELARQYLADPVVAVARCPKPEVKPVEPVVDQNGVLLPAEAFQDGWGPAMYSWFCKPGRMSMGIYATRSPRPSVMRTSFLLDQAPAKGALLDIEGQDSQNDLRPTTQIRISLNGKTVHEGDCGFVKRGWSRRVFDVEPGVLKAGENKMEIRNIYEGTQRLDGWWFMFSEAKLTFK